MNSIVQSFRALTFVFAAAAAISATASGCTDQNKVCSGSACACEAGKPCTLACTNAGGCEQSCAGMCDASCEAGNCRQSVTADSVGHATCAGGGCEQACSPQATSCDFTCAGGGCTQSCGGNANCKTTCTGGNCVTSPF